VQQGLEAARETGAAVAAVPVTDTVKRVGSAGLVLETPSREGLWSVQTPQVFQRELLAEAHQRVEETVTDDAAMVERLGRGVRVFLGSYSNLKVTTPTDLALAEAILRARCAPEG
jgi:2-C-methyl-D-erythritol 4-phosphate cytidylyltransferase